MMELLAETPNVQDALDAMESLCKQQSHTIALSKWNHDKYDDKDVVVKFENESPNTNKGMVCKDCCSFCMMCGTTTTILGRSGVVNTIVNGKYNQNNH